MPVFLEVGPGKTLGSLAKQNPAVNAQNVVSSLRHPEEKVDDRAFFQTVLGRLWALGVPLGAEALWPGEQRRRLPLPTYAFQGQRYWIDPGKAVAAREATGLPVKIEDRDRWFWAPAWRRLDPAGDAEIDDGTPAAPAAPSWMVFLDDAGVGDKLVAELRAQHQEVITVQAGDAFYKVSDREYWLNPEQGAEGYQALIHDVMASGRAPSRIVHLWLLAEGESFRPGSSFFHRNQERGFYSLLFLAQALSGQDYPRPLHVSVVSSGMQKVGNEPLAYPDMSTVLGPVKVMPREMPGVTCSSIDLPAVRRPEGLSFAGALDRVQTMAGPLGARLSDLVDKLPRSLGGPARNGSNGHGNGQGGHASQGNSDGALAPELAGQFPALLAELRLPANNDVVALRTDGRWIERHERTRVPALDETAAAPVLRPGGVYMITGGLGGIGAAMSRLMARELKARLVLIARTPLPERSEWARFASRNPNDPATARIRVVEQLEAAGAEVMVAAGDVADADRMAEIVAEVKQRFGALHGVIHAAGVLDDGLIPTKRQSQIEGVFGPKVHGTVVLDQVLRSEPLDFFVLFSSTSAAIASAGQVDYVAANTFLNSFARQARAQSGGSRKVVSVGWGIWSEVGMAASAARKMGLHPGVEAEGPVTSTSYPLFQEKRVQPRRGGVLSGTLQSKRTWMLDEHRTAKQRAVLPGTGYLELLRAAAREVGETEPFEIEDLFFFRPLEVADDAPVEFRVRLAPSDEGYRAEIQTRHRLSGGENNENGRVEGTGPGRGQGWLLHAQASLRFGQLAAPAKLDLRALDARCPKRTAEDPRGLRSKQEEHLNFGPRWRVLHQACYGTGEALGRLALPEKFRRRPGRLRPAPGPAGSGHRVRPAAGPRLPGGRQQGSVGAAVLQAGEGPRRPDRRGAELGAAGRKRQPQRLRQLRRHHRRAGRAGAGRGRRLHHAPAGGERLRRAQAADRRRPRAGGAGARARAVGGGGGVPARPEPGHHPGRGLAGAEARAGAGGARRSDARPGAGEQHGSEGADPPGRSGERRPEHRRAGDQVRPPAAGERIPGAAHGDREDAGRLLGGAAGGEPDRGARQLLRAGRALADRRAAVRQDPQDLRRRLPDLGAVRGAHHRGLRAPDRTNGGRCRRRRPRPRRRPRRPRRRPTRPATPTWCRCKVAAAARGTSCRSSWWRACSATC